jgi:drug/metabolite transporter (DMT)-like permease
VLLSAVVMSLHYVAVGVIGNASQLFGQTLIGGYLSLSSFSNATLLLWIRVLIVMPIMLGLATYLHPPTLREIRSFSRSRDRRTLWGVVGSGVFLFLSQVLLYIAIGQLSPGVAIALLFIYPVGSLLFGWLLFAEKITTSRLGIIVAVLLGALLSLYPLLMQQKPPLSAILAGLLATVMFTCYLVAMQIGARKIHPIPVSLIQFFTIFVLSSICLIAFGINRQPTSWTNLMVGGLVLAVLTVGSYALNHFGIRAVGAARSATIAASTPALTALLAFFLVPGPLTTLNFVQILGILLVTLGGTALSLERLLLQNKAARQAKLREEKAQEEVS